MMFTKFRIYDFVERSQFCAQDSYILNLGTGHTSTPKTNLVAPWRYGS